MSTRPVHVLLVEDDQSLRSTLARHLALAGFRIAEARSAEEASALVDDGLRPALVLLDLNLPGQTGWDFLRGGALVEAGNPPVIATTATSVNPRRLEELHVSGYLPKPFAVETLVDTVERYLGPRP